MPMGGSFPQFGMQPVDIGFRAAQLAVKRLSNLGQARRNFPLG